MLPEEGEPEIRPFPPFVPLIILLALLFVFAGLLYSMILLNGKYDIEIGKRENIIKELKREVELIRPLKLKITQYKQAIQTIEEEIQAIKEEEKKDSEELDDEKDHLNQDGGEGNRDNLAPEINSEALIEP